MTAQLENPALTTIDNPAGWVRLFSYGTLQEEAVQIATFGRVLSGSPDSLSGYGLRKVKVADPAVAAISGEAWHPIVERTCQPSDVVAGTVFEITRDELLKADAYEVDDYRRVSVILATGTRAWVYVQADDRDTDRMRPLQPTKDHK